MQVLALGALLCPLPWRGHLREMTMCVTAQGTHEPGTHAGHVDMDSHLGGLCRRWLRSLEQVTTNWDPPAIGFVFPKLWGPESEVQGGHAPSRGSGGALPPLPASVAPGVPGLVAASLPSPSSRGASPVSAAPPLSLARTRRWTQGHLVQASPAQILTLSHLQCSPYI